MSILLIHHFLDIFVEEPQLANLLILVLIEIEPIVPPKPYLRQVIIQRLFRNPHFVGSVLEGHPLELLLLIVVPIIKLPPLRDFLNDKANRPLFVPLVGQLGRGHLLNIHFFLLNLGVVEVALDALRKDYLESALPVLIYLEVGGVQDNGLRDRIWAAVYLDLEVYRKVADKTVVDWVALLPDESQKLGKFEF